MPADVIPIADAHRCARCGSRHRLTEHDGEIICPACLRATPDRIEVDDSAVERCSPDDPCELCRWIAERNE